MAEPPKTLKSATADIADLSDISTIRAILREAGAVAVGVVEAITVDPGVTDAYDKWLSRGGHAGMSYMESHGNLRSDPRKLLPDARSVIACAFSFAPAPEDDIAPGCIAAYAYGLDYHDVLRARLQEAIRKIDPHAEASWRICIDSAPIHERYWARKAGIGFIGRNGALIIPGHGSMVFIALVLTSLSLPADSPSEDQCAGCGRCLEACPGHAIATDATVDSRRCLSYLTIEHRGPHTSPESLATLSTPAGVRCLFGCDICLRVCPHNRQIPATDIAEFRPLPALRRLTEENTSPDSLRTRCRTLSQEEFSRIFKGSPIKRTKLAGLRRNAGAKDSVGDLIPLMP